MSDRPRGRRVLQKLRTDHPVGKNIRQSDVLDAQSVLTDLPLILHQFGTPINDHLRAAQDHRFQCRGPGGENQGRRAPSRRTSRSRQSRAVLMSPDARPDAVRPSPPASPTGSGSGRFLRRSPSAAAARTGGFSADAIRPVACVTMWSRDAALPCACASRNASSIRARRTLARAPRGTERRGDGGRARRPLRAGMAEIAGSPAPGCRGAR